MQINHQQITRNILNSAGLVKAQILAKVAAKFSKPPVAPATPQSQYGQVPLPLLQLGDRKKLIVMFIVVAIATAFVLPGVIRGMKVSTARPGITINLAKNKTLNRMFWVLVSAAVIAGITEKDWRNKS